MAKLGIAACFLAQRISFAVPVNMKRIKLAKIEEKSLLWLKRFGDIPRTDPFLYRNKSDKTVAPVKPESSLQLKDVPCGSKLLLHPTATFPTLDDIMLLRLDSYRSALGQIVIDLRASN